MATAVRRTEENPILAEVRLTGKAAAVKTRKDEKIPCVVSSVGVNDYLHVAVDRQNLVKEANQAGFFQSLYDLQVQGQEGQHIVRVLPQRVQVHPLTNAIRHAWFLQHKPGIRVKVKVPIEVNGRDKSPGLRLGGWLMTLHRHIEVECDIDDIPSKVAVDVSQLALGEALRMGQLDWDSMSCQPVKFNKTDPIVKIEGSRAARSAAKAE